MFSQLDKYRVKGHFFFTPTDSLEDVCNAPDDRDGVYLVYELKNDGVTLVYIGSSGEKIPGWSIHDGLLGLKLAIINGSEAERRNPRTQAWPVKMLAENIDALDIYWWSTFNKNRGDHPQDVKRSLMQTHRQLYGDPPAWNGRWVK